MRTVTIALAVTLLMLTPNFVSEARATPAAVCTPRMLSDEEIALQQTQSVAPGIALAESMATVSEAAQRIVGSTVSVSYLTDFDLWSLNQVSCAVTLEGIGIALNLSGLQGEAMATVMENPSMTSAVSMNISTNSVVETSGMWVGYEYYQNEAYWNNMAYYVPSVSLPANQPGGNGPCGVFGICTFSQWVGMTVTPNGGGSTQGIAQTGTDEEINSAPGVPGWTYVNEAWFQWYPQNPVNCFAVNAGAYTYPTVYYTGSDNYDMSIQDLTTGQACSETKTWSAMANPVYAEYMGEDPVDSNGVTEFNPVIPKFSQLPFILVASAEEGESLYTEYYWTQNNYGNAIVDLPMGCYNNITGCSNIYGAPPDCFAENYAWQVP